MSKLLVKILELLRDKKGHSAVALLIATPIVLTAFVAYQEFANKNIYETINLSTISERAATNAVIELSKGEEWEDALNAAELAPLQLGFDETDQFIITGQRLETQGLTEFFAVNETVSESDFIAGATITVTVSYDETNENSSSSTSVISLRTGSSEVEACLVSANAGASNTLKFAGAVPLNLSDCGALVLSSSADAISVTGGAVELDCVYGVVAQNEFSKTQSNLLTTCQQISSGYTVPYTSYMTSLLAEVKSFADDTAITNSNANACRTSSSSISSDQAHYCDSCVYGLPCTVFSGGSLILDGTKKNPQSYNLIPGLYIFDDTELEINRYASLTGTNVTLVLLGNSSISAGKSDGLGSIYDPLQAPQSGDFVDILVLADSEGVKDLDLSDNTHFRGLIYAPSASVSLHSLNNDSQSLTNDECAEIIGDTVYFQGGRNSYANLKKCSSSSTQGNNFEYDLYKIANQ